MKYLLPVLLCIVAHHTFAQSNFSATNFRIEQQSYTDISSSGTTILMTDNEDGSSASPQNIGFSFQFGATAFTQFMIHADGILRFGTSAPGAATLIAANSSSSHASVFTSSSSSLQNIILPFFTNLKAGNAPPQFHILTQGTAPNRICTVQWKNLRDADITNGVPSSQYANLEFQVKLYEGSNDIEFVYGNWLPSAATAGPRFAAIGIKASSGSFIANYKGSSLVSFSKMAAFSALNNSRASNSLVFRKDIPLPLGFSERFFGSQVVDAGVSAIYCDSITPAGIFSKGRIEALITNEGSTTLTNVPVALNISGANVHAANTIIASLAAGASQIVSFPDFNAANRGGQTVQVSVNAGGDLRTANNNRSLQQVVSQSQQQSFDIGNMTVGIGFNGSSAFIATKVYGSGSRKIRQVRIPFTTYRNVVGVRIYEDGGTSGSPSSSPLYSTAFFSTTSENILVIPVVGDVTVDGDYYVVVHQATTSNMGWRATIAPPIRLQRHFTSNTGTTWNQQTDGSPWQNVVEVYEENAGPDIGIEQVTSPGCDYSTQTEVKLTLRNFSANPINFANTPATISGSVRNPQLVESPFSITKNTGILAAGASEEITVLNNYDYQPRGTHLFSARSILSGDLEAGNDSLRFIINNNAPVTSSVTGAVCPLTTITLSGPTYLGNLQWNFEGSISSGSTLVVQPVKTSVVRVSGTDYRGCLLQDSVIIEVVNSGLPPKPVLLYGSTILSHRNQFRDTVRVAKLAGHTITWLGGLGTPIADSALILNQVAGMQLAKIAAAYIRTADQCANISDTITYQYIPGVLHTNNSTLSVCDTAYYDFGGATASTGNNMTQSFAPATPGKKIKLSFYQLDLAPFASLQVFDGPTTSSSRIVALSKTENGGKLLEYVASNETGALTIQFSIGSSTSQGWWAGITCHSPQVYRSVADGLWSNAATWETRSAGGLFVPANHPPLKADDTIYVRHNVLINNDELTDQVIVDPSGHLRIEGSNNSFVSVNAYKTVDQAPFIVKGKLSTSEFTQIYGGGEMFVTGELANQGQIDVDSVSIAGNTLQVLGVAGGVAGSIKHLYINNPAGVQLAGPQKTSGIRFANGKVHTNAQGILTITNGPAFVLDASDASHIDGPATIDLQSSSGIRLFPIGKNGIYRPVMVENSSSNSEASDFVTAEVMTGSPATRTLPASITSVSTVRYYRISRQGNSGTDFNVTLPYGADDGVSDPAGLTIAKDNGAGAWLDIGGTATGPTPGSITSASFNGFSDFVLANKTGGSNALPVTWLSFTASSQQQIVLLQWHTGSELNCSQYIVERSGNGIHFTAIGSVTCSNASSGGNYNYRDNYTGTGTLYYRIRQMDSDGKAVLSVVRKVVLVKDQLPTVYPNPANSVIVISNLGGGEQLTLMNAAGQVMFRGKAIGNNLRIPSAFLPTGAYMLRVDNETGSRLLKVMITH